MIEAVFERRNGLLNGVAVSGHAGYANAGEDIVCASVTSALQMAANGITEILKVNAAVEVEENLIRLTLPGDCPQSARQFLDALRLHLELLYQDYPNNIHLTTLEV